MANRTQQAETLRAALPQFTGTTDYFYRPHILGSKFAYTDGIRYLAQQTKCYWLIDLIADKQQFAPMIEYAYWQEWTLTVHSRYRATLTVTNGHGNIFARYDVKPKGFFLKTFTCYYMYGVLMLPSEY